MEKIKSLKGCVWAMVSLAKKVVRSHVSHACPAKSLLFQEQFRQDCLEALDGVGIAGCGGVGMIIGVHLGSGGVRNG